MADYVDHEYPEMDVNGPNPWPYGEKRTNQMRRLAKLIDFVINCDTCGTQDNTAEHSSTGMEPQTEKEAIKLLRSVGWMIGKTNLCPQCVEDKQAGRPAITARF